MEKHRKHRGLREIAPDPAEAAKHLAKAEHNLKAVLSFSATGFEDWAVSAAFYAIYHSFLAIIAKYGYESRNQECTIALIEHLNEKGEISSSHEIIDAVKHLDHEEAHRTSVIGLRENYQYGTETTIAEQELAELSAFCKKALEEAKSIVYEDR